MTAIKSLTSKYKDVKFKTESDFQQWLKEKAKFKIEFRDYGQDMTEMWIDEHGEILYTDMQSTIWCSKFVDVEKITVGSGIRMNIKGKFKEMDFVVKSCKELKP